MSHDSNVPLILNPSKEHWMVLFERIDRIELSSFDWKSKVINHYTISAIKINLGLVYLMRPFNLITNPRCGLFIFVPLVGPAPTKSLVPKTSGFSICPQRLIILVPLTGLEPARPLLDKTF